MRKWYSLIDKVYTLKNLRESFKTIKKRRGSRTSGVDGMSASDYEKDLEANLLSLQSELQSGRYRPKPVKRVYIKKPDGSDRPLGVPSIRDRVVQQALVNVLMPIFEPDFHPSSYGYRRNRSAHHAVAKAERFARQYGYKHVVDMDLSKCFDTLDHSLILSGINRKVSDGSLLRLVERFLKAGVLEGGKFLPTRTGSPQGGVLSPLLMNIYLDSFDQYMKKLRIRIVRYADDILVFAKTEAKAEEYREIAENYLEQELKLTVNKQKTHIAKLSSRIAYLGFDITSTGVYISEKSIKRFKDKVRELTPRQHGKGIRYYIKELSKLLRGYANYYRIGRYSKNKFRNLMSWIRRRLRMMKMVEWKSWKGFFRAYRGQGYRKDPPKLSMRQWRNSSCAHIQMALPNKWFKEKGLFDMEQVTCNTLHQYYGDVLAKV